ncbi:MAG: hypothetical protein DK305_000385 [Chloroflexi bacterium]|jgi:hypothetical protein|nr:MAG: hypothetical protein DK305_000385 [Chloroflexota bacterium]|tara:strand:+ start:3668 stop:4396 length:729 start_codon:yes stop_codon:yes gene_type:complete
MNFYFPLIKYEVYQIYQSLYLKCEIVLIFFVSIFLILVAYTENELTSETFAFFIFFLYLPSQFFKLLVFFSNLFNADYLKERKWIVSTSNSKSILMITGLVSYIFSACLLPIFCVCLFSFFLFFIPDNDLTIYSIAYTIIIIINFKIFLLLCFSFFNSLFPYHKTNLFLSSFCLFIIIFFINNLFGLFKNIGQSSLGTYINNDLSSFFHIDLIMSQLIFIAMFFLLICIIYNKIFLKFNILD